MYYLLLLKARVSYILSVIRRYLFTTKEVLISHNNNLEHHYLRYLLVYYLNRIVLFFKWIRDKIDIEVDKIQITREYNNGDKTIIVDSNVHYKDKVTLKDMINIIDCKGDSKDDRMNKCIFMKFELIGKDKKECMKKYMIKYKDHNRDYSHTLGNILLFNDINIDDDNDTKIKLTIYKQGKMLNKIIPYRDVYDKHISYFSSID
jgi:hypothetical protein